MRVNVVADLLEEHWPSMDLVADMLMSHLGRNGVAVSPVLVRPVFPMRLQSGTGAVADRTPLTIERIAHRFWDYPRWLRNSLPLTSTTLSITATRISRTNCRTVAW